MRNLTPNEMEFIADLADAQVNGALIVTPNGDTRYDDTSQNEFNDTYDQIETLYREVIQGIEFEQKKLRERLALMTEDLKELGTNFEQYREWVKEESQGIHDKAMVGVFGEYTCSHCRRMTHEVLEVEHGSEAVCEECYTDEYVRCERCDTKTIEYHTIYGDMIVCDVCKDDM